MKHFFLSVFAILLLASSIKAETINLSSQASHHGNTQWRMAKVSDIAERADIISKSGFNDEKWLDAIVPGTVLNSLVFNKIYPEPYYGLNNKIEAGIIPDIANVGRDFYTYWFRSEFEVPESFKNRIVWLRADGINYRAELWLNGTLVGSTKGMFMRNDIDVTDFIRPGQLNALAIKVVPVDIPGTTKPKSWGAPGEFRNGGNGDTRVPHPTESMTAHERAPSYSYMTVLAEHEPLHFKTATFLTDRDTSTPSRPAIFCMDSLPAPGQLRPSRLPRFTHSQAKSRHPLHPHAPQFAPGNRLSI